MIIILHGECRRQAGGGDGTQPDEGPSSPGRTVLLKYTLVAHSSTEKQKKTL